MEKVVRVIDSIMGSGKTTWSIRFMNEADSAKRFIFVTPFLEEVNRIISSVTNRQFVQPTHNIDGKKMTSFKKLVEDGKNIATTHSLFELIDDELLDLIRYGNYTLIIDEVISAIDKMSVSSSDMKMLLDGGYISVENNRVKWLASPHDYVSGLHDNLRTMAEAETLFYHRQRYLINTLSPKLFEEFDDVYVMTYMFEAQLMRYFFDLYGIKYELLAVQDGELVPRNIANEDRESIKALINIYDGKHNKHGEFPNAFSKRWLGRRSKDDIEAIKKSMYSYARRVINAKGDEIIWTTVKEHKNKLRGRGYTKSFLPCNARASNSYADCHTLMYCFNRYMNPHEKSFFQDNGVTVDEDKLALSDLLQWIWRSRIRRGEPINLFLPSSRMRKLLNAWLNGEV